MNRWVMLFVVLMLFGCAASEIPVEELDEPVEEVQPEAAVEEESAPDQLTEEIKEEPFVNAPQWIYGGSVIEGNYADSDFVELGNGQYRMYYAVEPEVPGNKLEVYSAVSRSAGKICL